MNSMLSRPRPFSWLRSSRSLSWLVLILGVALFTTAAFADLVSGSPYGDFKEAIKFTSRYFDDSYTQNFTTTALISYSLDGQVQSRIEEVERYALDQGQQESQRITWRDGVQSSSIRIEDGTTSRLLQKSSDEDTWFVYEGYPCYRVTQRALAEVVDFYPQAMGSASIGIIGGADGPTSIYLSGSSSNQDPFDNPRVQDLERILDLFVGNLANLLQAETTLDGGKHYSGTVIGAQLPSLVQAMAGLVSKQALTGLSLGEVQIEQVSGEASQTPEGWLSKIVLQVRLSGVDSQNTRHVGQIDFGFEIDNLGTTTVNLPDLSSLNARYENYRGYEATETTPLMAEKDFGLYRSYYLREVDGAWQRVAERNLDLREENGLIKGHFWEVPFEEWDSEPLDFYFTVGNNRYSRDEFTVVEVISGVGADGIVDGWIHYGGYPGMMGFNAYIINENSARYNNVRETEWTMVFAVEN